MKLFAVCVMIGVSTFASFLTFYFFIVFMYPVYDFMIIIIRRIVTFKYNVPNSIHKLSILLVRYLLKYKCRCKVHFNSCTCATFLTCVNHIVHVIDIGWTSVRLSVCTSHAGMCQNGSTAQPIVKLSSQPASPMILVF